MEFLREGDKTESSLERNSKNPIGLVEISSKYQGSTKNDAYTLLYRLYEDYKFEKANFLLQELYKSGLSARGLKELEMFRDIEQINREILFLTEQMDIEKDWNTEKVRAGEEHVVLKYKKLPGEQIYALKYEANLKIPIFNLISMIYEVDLFQLWVPFCNSAKTIKKIAKAFKIAYFHLELPFISNREGYIKGIGVDRLEENGTLLIISGSVDVDEEFQRKYEVNIPLDNKSVRLSMSSCAMEIKPESRNKFKTRLISSCDPKMAFIPDFVINFCLRKGGSYFFEKMICNSKNIEGTEWEKRIKGIDDRDFYLWVEERLEGYFKSKNL